MLAAVKPKGGCDVPLRKTLLALALLMTILSLSRHKRPTIHLLPAVRRNRRATATDCRIVEARAARSAGCADCALSRRTAGKCTGGVDLSAGMVQADRWLKARKTLKGDALKKEVEKQSWDDSVKALASTADVISMMSDKIDWTKSLGDAYSRSSRM